MYRTIRMTRRSAGMAVPEVVVMIIVVALLLAVTLPVLAANAGGMGIAGSKRNLMHLHMAHQMYAADYNGNQWVNVAHDLATFGDTYQSALDNWIDSLGGCDHPFVSCVTGQWSTYTGWGPHPTTGQLGLWLLPWNVYTMPIHLVDSSHSHMGIGFHLVMNTRSFNPYVNGKVYDRTYFAPQHNVALSAVGECFDLPYELCIDPISVYFTSSYSLSPAALYHPGMWSVPESEFPEDRDAVFAEFDNAFHALPYSAAKYPDLKTHISEHFWLQNNTQGECHPNLPGVLGSYHGCQPWRFNASIHSAPVTLFYDGHVRLLPLTEVKQADDKIGVWRRDTPMGLNGYRQEYGMPGDENPHLSHHILTNGGILGRDTIGP